MGLKAMEIGSQFKLIILVFIKRRGKASTDDVVNGLGKGFLMDRKRRKNTSEDFNSVSQHINELVADEVLQFLDKKGRTPYYGAGTYYDDVLNELLDEIINCESIELWNEDGKLRVSVDDEENIYINLQELADIFVEYDVLERNGYCFDFDCEF